MQSKTNVSKSNCMIFSLRHVDSEYGPAVMLVDTMLEEIYTSKLLGIHPYIEG